MTNDNPKTHFSHATVKIDFTPNTSFIGAGTNGAMPQAVTALYIESQIHWEENENKIDANHWLKVVTADKNIDGKPLEEYMMYTNDIIEIEKVLSAIVSVSIGQRDLIELQEKFNSYHNSRQLEHDEETSEECIDKTLCRVRKTRDRQFEVLFYSLKNAAVGGRRENERPVCRLNAELSGQSLTKLTVEFGKLLDFIRTSETEIIRSISQPKAAA